MTDILMGDPILVAMMLVAAGWAAAHAASARRLRPVRVRVERRNKGQLSRRDGAAD